MLYWYLSYYKVGGRSTISITTIRTTLKSPQLLHVSQLCKHIPDPSHVIELEPLQLWENLTYGEEPIEILDNREKQP